MLDLSLVKFLFELGSQLELTVKTCLDALDGEVCVLCFFLEIAVASLFGCQHLLSVAELTTVVPDLILQELVLLLVLSRLPVFVSYDLL
jgi:hypothetical protein